MVSRRRKLYQILLLTLLPQKIISQMMTKNHILMIFMKATILIRLKVILSCVFIFPEHLTLPKKSDYLFVMRFLGSKEKHLSICCPHLEKDTSSVDIFILDGLCTSGRDSSCTPTTYFNSMLRLLQHELNGVYQVHLLLSVLSCYYFKGTIINFDHFKHFCVSLLLIVFLKLCILRW